MPNRRESNVSILQRYNNSKLRSTYQWFIIYFYYNYI